MGETVSSHPGHHHLRFPLDRREVLSACNFSQSFFTHVLCKVPLSTESLRMWPPSDFHRQGLVVDLDHLFLEPPTPSANALKPKKKTE
eukprot:2031204-Pyramimonas_sp.AAC.1